MFKTGGIIASVILIAFGIASIAMGTVGRGTVGDEVKREKIVGTPDMNPTDIKKAAEEAGLKDVDFPDCDVAGEKIDTGGKARCFAQYMRIHALESSGGQTYAEMPRFLGKDGKPVADEKQAAVKNGRPVDNPQRSLWVTETALSTALNTSYFAQQVAMFSIIMGIALLLTGIGFLVLTTGLTERHGRAGAGTTTTA